VQILSKFTCEKTVVSLENDQLLGVVTPVSSRYNLCHFGAAEKASLSRFVPLLQRLLEKRETKGAACCDIRGTVLVILGPSGIPVAKCV